MSRRSNGPIWARIALAFGAGVFALVAGTALGARFLVPEGQGLAGPAEALGYGLVAALVGLVLGWLVSSAMGRHTLIVAALMALSGVLVLGATLYLHIQAAEEARRDPDSAYAGLPAFTARLEQVTITDPYLRIEIGVDSAERAWRSVGPAPAHQTCQGGARAEALHAVAAALHTLTALPDDALEVCRATEAEAERRLSFAFADGSKGGELGVSKACQEQTPEIAALLRAMDRLTLDPSPPVSCD